MKKFLAGAVIVVVSLFVMSVSMVLAQDACEGNFDYDKDVDGGDAALFKSDFGRSPFSNPCPPKGPAPVPKTGQTTVYGSRDDGYWQQAVGVQWPNPRFTDNLDGTITDNLTGLIWLKHANCFGLRTWDNALSDSNGLADGSCGLTDGSSAGDWRIPNRFELASLLNLSYLDPAISHTPGFTHVQSYYYWSSTTTATNSGIAWYVDMGYGVVSMKPKSDVIYVWPVRGGH